MPKFTQMSAGTWVFIGLLAVASAAMSYYTHWKCDHCWRSAVHYQHGENYFGVPWDHKACREHEAEADFWRTYNTGKSATR